MDSLIDWWQHVSVARSAANAPASQTPANSVEAPMSEKGVLAVIGLGYIGVPTSVAFALRGWTVIGVDVNHQTVNKVNSGELPFEERGLQPALEEAVQSGKLNAQVKVPTADAYIICVPTPLKENKTADLSFVRAAIRSISSRLEAGNAVVIESTMPPGTTEDIANLISKLRPDLCIGCTDSDNRIYLGYAPERVLPGRVLIELSAIDRVIGGIDSISGERIRDIYATFCTGEIQVTDTKTAELTKLAENSFRDINIAFANELSLICSEIGVDVWKLISLANRHPRVNVLSPGPGVGGHCIAVDPWFLAEAAPQVSSLIRTAREVNSNKEHHVARVVQGVIDRSEGEISRILMMGLAFKPNIDDLRESPALSIATRLAQVNPGLKFNLVEPFIELLPETLNSLGNVSLLPIDELNTDEQDLVVLLVAHEKFKSTMYELNGRNQVLDFCGISQKVG